MIIFLLIFISIPIACVALAVFLMYNALSEPSSISWWELGISIFLFGALAALVYPSRRLGYGFAGVVALSLLVSYIVTTIGAIWMLHTLPRWRKLAALIVGLLFPLATQVSAFLMFALPYKATMVCELGATAAQIEAYHRDHTIYPAQLDAMDTYLHNAPQACLHTPYLTGNLLYSRTATGYSLANWRVVDTANTWIGPLVCRYDESATTIACGLNQWGPFNPSFYEHPDEPILQSP